MIWNGQSDHLTSFFNHWGRELETLRSGREKGIEIRKRECQSQ